MTIANFVKTWKEYQGEEIIKSVNYVDGQQVLDKVVYPKISYPIKTKGYAIVLGNGVSRSMLTVDQYYNSNGGLRNKYKAETYGCNAIYRDGLVDHLVINNYNMLQDAIDQKLYNRIGIYTHYSYCLKIGNMNKVRLIPQRLIADSGTMALYLACFHGNHTVWMVGFDHLPGKDTNVYEGTEHYADTHTEEECRKWVEAQDQIMKMYPEVSFIRVTKSPGKNRNNIWLSNGNYTEITNDEFIKAADIGLVTIE